MRSPALAALLPLWLVASTPAAELRLRLWEQSSGLPTAARVQIFGPGGALFESADPSLLSHSWLPIGPYVHVDGELLLTQLAPGSYTVLARRGPTGRIELGTAGLTTGISGLDLWLSDWVEPTDFGWYAGDPHLHGTHEGGQVYAALDGPAIARAAAAEGLDVVFSLDNDPVDVAGLRFQHANCSVQWGIEYRSGWWGHVSLVGLPAPLPSNYCCSFEFGGLRTLSAVLPASAAELAILSHPVTTATPLVDGAWPSGGHGREAAAAALQAAIQGYAVGSGSNGPTSNWAVAGYLDLLRTGARLSAVGESDAALDRYGVRPPGYPRSYVQLDAPLAVDDPAFASAWIAALHAGRSFASDGPVLLRCELDTARLGETLALSGAASAELHLHIVSELGFNWIRVHGQAGLRQSWSWSANRPLAFENSISLNFAHDDFVLVEAEAQGMQGISHLVSSPIWVDAPADIPDPIEPARRNVDDLRAFLSKGELVRGYVSPAEQDETRTTILAAADHYEAMADDPPGNFALLYPTPGQSLPNTTATFRWRWPRRFDGEPLHFELWLASDANFVSAQLRGVSQDSFLALTDLPIGEEFHWRVLAVEPDEPARANDLPNGLARVQDNPVATEPATAFGFELGPIRQEGEQLRWRVHLPRRAQLSFEWYDVRGRAVRLLAPEWFESGDHELAWDGRDARGMRVSAGMYWLAARSANGERRTGSGRFGRR